MKSLALVIVAGVLGVAHAGDPPPTLAAETPAPSAPRPVNVVESRFVNANRIILSIATDTTDRIHRVEPWLSTDGGTIWKPADAKRHGDRGLRFDAPRDGRYDFFIVIETAGGRSDAPPAEGTSPHATIVVDTAAPTLQIHRVASLPPTIATTGKASLQLDLTVRDENLGSSGVRLFYRDSRDRESAWVDGGVVVSAAGSLDWTPPPDVPDRLDIRLIAIDRAGNRATDEVLDVPVPKPTAPASVDAPSIADAGPTTPEGPDAAAVPTSRTAVLGTTDEKPAADARELARLRRLADFYRLHGRFALAAGRLEEALRSFPDDSALMVELGAVLVRAGRPGDARRQFESAMARDPGNEAAIDALAGLAMSQRNYREARDLLSNLVRLPNATAELWLRLGDAEQRLGNRLEAAAAWSTAERHSSDEGLRARIAARRQAAATASDAATR